MRSGRLSAPIISQNSIFVGLDPELEDTKDSDPSLSQHDQLEVVENRKEIEESYLEEDKKYQANLIDINEKLDESLKLLGLSGSLKDLTRRRTTVHKQLTKKKVEAYEERSSKRRESSLYEKRRSSLDKTKGQISASVLMIDFSNLKKLPNRKPKHIAILGKLFLILCMINSFYYKNII